MEMIKDMFVFSLPKYHMIVHSQSRQHKVEAVRPARVGK
jgi:hypothetical protein